MKPNASFLVLGFMIACSLCGSVLVLLIVAYPPTTMQDYFWRKPLFGSIWFLICAGGSLAAISPKNCSAIHQTFATVETNLDKDVRRMLISSKGHHPNCGKFKVHTIQFRRTSYCAACTGLFIGGVAAMVVTVLYFFSGLSLVPFSFPAVVIGLLGLGSGLLQSKLKSLVRSAANLLFVLGGLFLLIGADQLIESLFIDFYVTGLIVLWILTRVLISQWNHNEICRNCGFLCEATGKVGVLASTPQPVESANDH